MPKRDADDEVDREGVAAVLGVAAATVTKYVAMYADTDTPTPDPLRVIAGRHKLYSAQAWRKWNQVRGRKLGRPSKPCTRAAEHGQKPCPECGRRNTGRAQEGQQ